MNTENLKGGEILKGEKMGWKAIVWEIKTGLKRVNPLKHTFRFFIFFVGILLLIYSIFFKQDVSSVIVSLVLISLPMFMRL
ncbi:hypothetical protein KKG83_00245 [Candidatus Micrarchaeota archaeon]|nr:hypothetical protein [Candidatus Micrarchaeota archaeon]